MNDTQRSASDNIPVLSDIVKPGSLPVALATKPVMDFTVHENPLTKRLQHQADILLAEMEERIEYLVEEELARAHSSALETARIALQQRLRAEMEQRLNAFIADALHHHDA